jgi:hypothetical protein
MGLMNPLLPRKIGDGLPLRAGEALMSGALLEASAQQARDFVQQEAEIWIARVHGMLDINKPAYYQWAYNKRDFLSQVQKYRL